jgi:hypothetical protein
LDVRFAEEEAEAVVVVDGFEPVTGPCGSVAGAARCACSGELADDAAAEGFDVGDVSERPDGRQHRGGHAASFPPPVYVEELSVPNGDPLYVTSM